MTELLSGGELVDKLLEKVYYEEVEAKEVIRQVLLAIAYCHSKNIVHRDIKAEVTESHFVSQSHNTP